MVAFGRPAQADQVVFGERGAGGDVEIGEVGAHAVIKRCRKLFGTVNVGVAVMQHTVRRQQLKNGFAAALVPHFFKPAHHQVLVGIHSGERLGSGHVPSLVEVRQGYRKLALTNMELMKISCGAEDLGAYLVLAWAPENAVTSPSAISAPPDM